MLVQDYHFALLPGVIRRRLPRATILTFWHIPWPSAERFAICPWDKQLLEGLLGSSIIGFHTQAHCNNFLESVDRTLEARIDRERQSVVLGGRETLVRAYPISVEWPSRWLEPVASGGRLPGGGPARSWGFPPTPSSDWEWIVSTTRRGSTTGSWPWSGSWSSIPSSRGGSASSRSRRRAGRSSSATGCSARTWSAIASRINDRFGHGGRGPVVLLARFHHDPPDVFRLYRAADLCYVSSLHDGMNLVAKEFVAPRDDLRGVLVLSRFTGAARELTEALLVNPYDLDAASAALLAAVKMPEAEQEERMWSLRNLVSEFNVYRWAGRMLLDATSLRRRDRLTSRLGGEEPASAEHGP